VLGVSLGEPEEQLSARELAILSTHVHNWRALAQELSVQDMEDIAKRCRSSKECCYEVFRISKPSRRELVTALESPGLQYYMLARYLETG